MRKFFTLTYLLPLLILSTFCKDSSAQVSMTTTGSYSQDFNTLINTGTAAWTDNSTLANWYAQKSTAGAITYVAGTGSSNTGALYSFGSGISIDRALGTVGSGTPRNFAYGMLLRNTSGTTITSIKVTYTMEQWRNGGNTSAQDVTFYFQKSASPITDLQAGASASYTQVPGLTVSSLVNTATATSTDGNAPANRTTVSNISLPGLSLLNNEYIMLKWDDPDNSGNDHGLSIDDVTISWTVTPVISSNAELSSLSLNSGAVPLIPSFTPVNGSYTTAAVSNSVSAINLSFTKADANSFVEARINGGAYGSPLASLPLNVGPNTIDIRITAQDGVTVKLYTITVTRNAAATPTLSASALPAFGTICTGTTTAANSFTLNGNDLDGSPISIGSLDGFLFSESAGGTFSSTLSFSTGAVLSGKPIYVKFNPTNTQSYNGDIIVTGGGASSISVAASGTGINTGATVNTGSNIVAGNSASLNGSISATGCGTLSSYGFEYSTTPGFVNGTGVQVTAVNLNAGAFSRTVSGLTGATTYYYKAFVTTTTGTSYGSELSFATSSVVPVVMSEQSLLRYTENFNSIATWANNFASGTGANHFSSVTVNAAGSIPSAARITTATTSFSSGTSGGVQKGSGSLLLLTTGATDNTSSAAVDFYMDFTGVNAGTLSFDWASVNNSTGDRKGSLRVYASTDGVSYTELVAADVLNFTNNVPSTGTVNSIALPASFSNSSTARLRFYYHNGSGGTTGSRPKISIDNLIVTGLASSPCVTPSAAPTSLTFGTITETSIQGNFVAASPAVNEYLVIMSTNSTLTSNPLDGQSYVAGDNVGDGTVIAKGNDLNFTATDLTGATTYYFFIFSVNSVCTGGPKYQTTDVLTDEATTVAGLPNCTAPLTQATDLTLTTATNSIQGTFTATTADEYLVLQSTSASLSGTPANGVVYNAGAVLGDAIVIQRSSATTFTASGLTPATQYYYYIFSINSQACLNGPVYNTVSPLSGTAATQPLPVCVTPSAQPANLSFNSSNNSVTATFNAAGSGYNYLVVMSSSPTLSATPVDNIDYAAGSSLGGGTVISNATSTSFIATSLTNSTTYYFFVFSANKNCTGGTKYLVASPLTGNATTTNAPVNNYYFGNLHAHSDYSDGQKDNPGGTPAAAYTYAAASQGMDFLGISEHNHFSTLNNPGNELANYHLGVAQAAAFNSSHSNFVALYGMEWGVISGGGHVLVYGDGMNDLFGWESNVNGNVGPNYDVYVPKNTYLGVEGLFKKVNDYVAKNTFASLAHPNNTDFNNLSNIPYDQSADDAISGVAVESGPATSANTTYSNPSSMNGVWYYNKLLSKGYHLGPMIDHDNHNTTFGRHTAARTAVIAPALTQFDIIKGVRDMHFYATEDMDARVDFTINTRIMGSIFEDRNAPSIAVNLTDATNPTSDALIRVMFGKPGSNITPVVVDSVFASSLSYVDNNLANHETGYYYIDITYGGKRIVTSPIWYTRTCASSSETTVTACNSFDWYGTLYTTSTVATKVFTTVGGCDSTVTLHLTINNSPSSATIALVGSDTGCPGAGVALTATADGNITSYQWLQDGNVVATTATGTYTALTSGGYSVRAVNIANCSVVSANSLSVTVADNSAPVPDVAVLPVITGQCSATAVAAPTATDNCAGTLTATTSDPVSYTGQGTYTIHWNFADGNGNTTSQEQTVIIQDNIAPVADVAVLPVITAQCAVTIASTPTASDNCSGTVIATTTDALTYSAQGTYTIHWSYNDGHGNISTQEQTVIVADTQKPTITAPATYSMVSDAGQCGATIASIGTPVVADNCGVASVTNDHPSTYYPVGTTIVTWKVTDVNGNITDTAKQTIHVMDNEMPTITVTNVSVNNDPGSCGANVILLTPPTHDNCGVASVTNKHPSISFPIGVTNVVWTVTDNSGWTTTAIQTVTVTDAQVPTVVAQPLTVYLTAAGIATITASQLNNGSTDNCGISSYSVNKTSFDCSNLGDNTVSLTVTDVNGNSASASVVVSVKDNTAPTITPVTNQVFCTGSSSYSIPVLTAADNCNAVIVSYTVTGATTRSGTGNNASGSFNNGMSTINWTVKDASGNTSTSSTTVTINALPAVTIAASSADAFCNKLTLTASSIGTGATYKWMSGSTVFATTPAISLGQTNGDGIYQVFVTVNGCTSAAASYNFQKQNLASSYTILAFDRVDLGTNNIVASGSVGVTANSGEAEFGSNSSVSSPGSFVKAKKIDKNGSNISIANPIYSAATGITLPTMLLNTASTNNLPNKDVAQNSVSTVNGNYKNLTLKKGSRTTVTGNTFGTIRVEQGAQVTFTAGVINIDNLQIVKGPRYGYSYVRFAGDAKVLVSTSVSIGSQVYVNPDNNNVTFYMGDKKSDEERFTVKGGDTKVTANIYVPNGKLKVTGGYSYGNYGNGYGDCDRDDDEERYYGQGSSYVNMTGLFVAEKIEGNGKNVIWNSFDCSSVPVPVLNTITQVTTAAKEEGSTVTTEEDLKLTVLPNPSSTYFTLRIESRYTTPVNMRVMDSRGRVVDARSKLGSNSTIQIGQNYASGTYYAEMIQGGVKKVVQLIKQK